MGMSEADTCRVLILPKILEAGWNSVSQINEQIPITDGRIHVHGRSTTRGAPKKPDYVLKISENYPIAVIEAKKEDEDPSKGLQQAINYAEMLGVRWAFSTNGHRIIQRDLKSGEQKEVTNYPSPDELWNGMADTEKWSEIQVKAIQQPFHNDHQRTPRYYQEKAVNRAVECISGGNDKALLCLATGTGKSFIAAQICYRL
jgi:type I restriction enzyme, R subunit